MSFFVTGTDTGVGKTYLIVQLLRLLRANGLRCAGFKPICCGDRRDAQLLLAASSNGITIDEINPLWLRTPAAPFTAAFIEHVDIEIEALLDRFEKMSRRFDLVLAEGVGGWLVPLTKNYFVSDLAVAMKLPVIVVAQNKLGCLNHSLLTLQAIERNGAQTAALVLNPLTGDADVASSTNADVLRDIIDLPILPMLHENVAELPLDWCQLPQFRALPSVQGDLSKARTQV